MEKEVRRKANAEKAKRAEERFQKTMEGIEAKQKA
jgi:hypothetical protein